MGEGLCFARLATLIGKTHGARYGTRRVTIGAVGLHKGQRFVMGTLSNGVVVLGEPQDFTVPEPRRRRDGRRVLAQK